MKRWFETNWRKFLIFPPILVGGLVVLWLVRNQRELDRRPVDEVASSLRVIKVAKVDVVPSVVGYGTAQPRQVWRAIAEVRGKIIHLNKNVESGGMLKAGDVLVKIDPKETDLQISQLQAQVDQAKAQLEELKRKEKNYLISKAIEKRAVDASRRLYDSEVSAFTKGAGSENDVAKARQDLAIREQNYQSILNSLELLPSQESSLKATLRVNEAKLEQANLDREKTVIKSPFACRLGDVKLREGQYVSPGEQLFEAYNTDVAEIEVQVALDQGRRLIPKDKANTPLTELSPEIVRKLLQLTATVEVRNGVYVSNWPATFDRVRERVNPETRTAGVVVLVHEPYKKAQPGKRPPLLKGNFCTVRIQGKVLPGKIIIPRPALHNQTTVYVLDKDNRLRKRTIEVAFAQEDFICIQKGLSEGDVVIVSDPTPAISGMLVAPKLDNELAERLRKQAGSFDDLSEQRLSNSNEQGGTE